MFHDYEKKQKEKKGIILQTNAFTEYLKDWNVKHDEVTFTIIGRSHHIITVLH
jgi:hypothetical protein